jgi:GNAT superfamily N-acetyltransferase
MSARMRTSMAAFYRLIGQRSPGGRLFERPGLTAAIAPSCPERSVVNGVVYETADGLAAVLEDLASAYEDAGVRAWTVWVPETDTAAAHLLDGAGHRLDATPRAMTLELTRAELGAGAGDVAWELTDDTATFAAINEDAYGLAPGEFTRVMTAFADPAAMLYLARREGRPAACLAALTAERDCGIYMVATARTARRQGFALALMRQALRDARDRGATTSSLQATRLGTLLYQRLGYRDQGAIEMWERRTG